MQWDWPWLAIAGLGVFHGLNPTMGWLFAVALGLHRKSRKVVLLSLIPIALGHAVAVATALALALILGVALDMAMLKYVAAALLIGWAAWLAFYGHRMTPRIGMTAGLLSLALWSFLMASVHGAGLMLLPIVLPICADGSSYALITDRSTAVMAAALLLHTAAMLATIGAIALIVYEWIGLGFLRAAWINLDRLWILALAGSGMALLIH